MFYISEIKMSAIKDNKIVDLNNPNSKIVWFIKSIFIREDRKMENHDFYFDDEANKVYLRNSDDEELKSQEFHLDEECLERIKYHIVCELDGDGSKDSDGKNKLAEAAKFLSGIMKIMPELSKKEMLDIIDKKQ